MVSKLDLNFRPGSIASGTTSTFVGIPLEGELVPATRAYNAPIVALVAFPPLATFWYVWPELFERYERRMVNRSVICESFSK